MQNSENKHTCTTQAAYNTLLEELEATRQELAFTQDQLKSAQEKLHQAQKAQKNTQKNRDKLLENLPLPTQVWSKNMELQHVNKEAVNLFGFATEQEYINNFSSTLPEIQASGENSLGLLHSSMQEALHSGYARKNFIQCTTQGEIIPLDLTFVSNTMHGEDVICLFMQDLREQHEIKKTLRESDEYSKVMLDASPIGVMIWDENLAPIDCNTAMAETFGLQKERSAFMQNLTKLYPEVQPDGIPSLVKMQEQLQKAFKEGFAESPWMGLSIDGKEVPTLATAVRTKHNDQNMVVVFYKDLREIEKSIRKAQAAEKRTEAILNGVPVGINILTEDMQVIDCNDEAVRIAGFGSKEALLESVMQSFPEVQPDGTNSLLFLQEKFAEVKKNGKSRFELIAINGQGNPYPLDVTTSRAHFPDEDLYIAYCIDLSEAKKMVKDLKAAKEFAEKSAMAKSEFLANMSHEIRTPMNGILGLLRILSNTNLNEAQKSYMHKALFSTKELLRIINDILDFSKIEAGKLELEVVPFTMHEICADLQGLFDHAILAKGLTCRIDEGDFAEEAILGDPLRLKQVLFNLVNNAIKFTEKGSIDVEIQSTKQEDNTLQCQFKVTDTGIGLSAKQTENLFSAFTQADTSVTRKYGGTGLGLAISKSIVNMLQGSIWVESVLGEGSSFYFTATFPLTDKEMSIETSIDTTAQEKTLCEGHILLVEDNQINQIIAEELLQSFGYTLDIANNGQEALDMLASKKYDIVLMDIQMPVMDGLSATKAIRANPDFAHLPVLAMSAHAMAGDKEKSLEHGMNDHITKPISPDILYHALRHWIKWNKS